MSNKNYRHTLGVLIFILGIGAKSLHEQKLLKDLCVGGTHWVWTDSRAVDQKDRGVCVNDMVPHCTSYNPFTSQCKECDWLYQLKNLPDMEGQRRYSGWGCHIVAWEFWTMLVFAAVMAIILGIGCCNGWRVCRRERGGVTSGMESSRGDQSYTERLPLNSMTDRSSI
jgi:hypothetical protein